ncbi:mitogen-activated protein kinase kinase kinase 6 isoform X3 [Choloepus didactylus]|uniref:mitogen-activated protein kinase kinase kinase 6 isoform X3 n=1 Tax=Choloepus didactylus TaxID=27675 RepID=UPI0018A09367|nr:mitogen-activated protein kinase kinase kinase 6 isoform X3 [Choloepus didactylus]XP_037683958.1 mitogen-activated protein kinase kinase kinase 6 isoform X3 [Choloepus didactylus]
MAEPGPRSGTLQRAGSCWQDPLAEALSPGRPLAARAGRGCAPNRPLSVVFVLTAEPRTGAEPGAGIEAEPLPLRCLREACAQLPGPRPPPQLSSLPFGTLALGDTAALDSFYNADVVVLEVSSSLAQPSLFYHLGVRESFSMTNNVLLCAQADLPDLQALREDVFQKNSDCVGSYTLIPYVVTASGRVLCGDAGVLRGLADGLVQAGAGTEALLTPLVGRLVRLLETTPTDSCGYFRETIRQNIRQARERFSGQRLRQELARLQRGLDSVELLSADVIMNLLLSYRDVQDYSAIIDLVETLQALPTYDVTEQHNVCFHYTFALNRRNRPGDREKALAVLLPLVQCECSVAPDLYCMCGRVYKDMFFSSGFQDAGHREQAYHWYRKAFEVEPSLHSGINAAVLLIAAGQRFEDSEELQLIGMKLGCLLARKGCVEKMQYYWDVGFYLGAQILANDPTQVVLAAEQLYKLDAPIWYLVSVMETFLLYQHFRPMPKAPGGPLRRAHFWLHFLLQSCQPFKPTSLQGDQYLVLVLELNKVLLPARLEVGGTDTVHTVTLSLLESRTQQDPPSSWTFPVASICGISASKRDERCCFLYALPPAQDVQLCFPSVEQCQWFCGLIQALVTNPDSTAPAEEAEGVGEVLEFDYEYTETGERLVLGKGTYGVVYAGRDRHTRVRIAIKEIPERDSRFSQPLHEEIALHKRLRHKNIVRYLGSASQGGYLKIFMEEVPGGSLSSLLRSVWGPLQDNESTISFYTRQILQGLGYLHDNHIVHRDIKGDNVLINTFSGLLKISDFGTSKRLAGITPCTETFTGTLQYMAPEIIDQGPRGYGKAADIWSLGCTVIEMATGRPPFHELGSPQAAMFQVGMYKVHPPMPSSLSAEAQAFLLRTFEPDPHLRANAQALLEDPFLQPGKRSRSPSSPRPSPRPSDAPSASPTPSAASTTQSQTFPCPHAPSQHLPSRQKRCLSYGGTSQLRVPEDPGAEEPALSEESSALSLLHQESKRRAMLAGVLEQELPALAEKLRLAQEQGPLEPHLGWDLMKQLLHSLRTHIHTPNRRQLAQELRALQEQLRAHGLGPALLHGPLFAFPDAVKQILRRRQIRPHWMFVLDSLLSRAVRAALAVLGPEVEKEAVPPPSEEPSKEEGSQQKQHETPVQGSSLPLPSEPERGTRPLMVQLGLLRAETVRLRAVLGKKEQECQALVQQVLQQVHGDARTCALASEPPAALPADQGLVKWLQELSVDSGTIQTLLNHSFTLHTLLTCATRDDLIYTHIRSTRIRWGKGHPADRGYQREPRAPFWLSRIEPATPIGEGWCATSGEPSWHSEQDPRQVLRPPGGRVKAPEAGGQTQGQMNREEASSF